MGWLQRRGLSVNFLYPVALIICLNVINKYIILEFNSKLNFKEKKLLCANVTISHDRIAIPTLIRSLRKISEDQL